MLIRNLACSCKEFGIIVYLKLYGSLEWIAFGIGNTDSSLCYRSIVGCDIYLGIAGSYAQNLFRPVVFAESLCVHEHSTRCGSIEPGEVKYRFRLTSTKEVPFAVNPGFYPCMVIVGMCPTWSIYLACRDSDSTQGSDGECRFLAATAVCGADGGKRCACTYIARCICYFLMTPMVDLKHCVTHREALYPAAQFVIEYRTAVVHIFVVHTHRQHEVIELPCRHFLAPWHFIPRHKGIIDILQMELCRVIDNVGQRHVGIKELHSMFPFAAEIVY